MRLTILFFVFILMLSVQTGSATNSIASSFVGNSTYTELTPTWAEYLNTTISTGSGNTTVSISTNAMVNWSTAIMYGRIKRDGSIIEQFNITRSTIPELASFVMGTTETLGSHYYTFEAYSTAGKKGIIYNRSMTVIYINDGNYSGSGSGNITSISGTSPIQVTGTTDVVVSISDINRSLITGQTDIDTLQNNTDTALKVNDTYFNGTIFPNSTNFRNDTIGTKEPIISSSTASKFYAWDKTWKDILISYIPGLSLMLDSMNNSAAANDTASRGRDDAINVTTVALKNNDTYFNGSVFPLSANFRNDTVGTKATLDEVNSSAKLQSTGQVTNLDNILSTMNNSVAANDTAINNSISNIQGVNIAQNNTDTNLLAQIGTINITKTNKTDFATCGASQYSKWNGTGAECFTDQTSAFSIAADSNSPITGASRVISGTGVNLVQSGSNITINMPAAGITNESVNPYSFNLSNGTGTLNESHLSLNYSTHAQSHTLNGSDHTGPLDYSRLNNILINLSSSSNFTGVLAKTFLADYATWDAKIGSISGVAPIVATTISQATTITINMANSTQSGYLSSSDFVTFMGKADGAFSNATFATLTLLNGKANGTYVNNTFATISSLNSKADGSYTNTTLTTLAMNDSVDRIFTNNSNRVRGQISFESNSSRRQNGSDITKVPGPYNGTVTALNITVVEGSGTSNVSLFISGTYIANVNLTSGSNVEVSGLSSTFTISDTLRWKLDTASTNLRFTITTRTTRT